MCRARRGMGSSHLNPLAGASQASTFPFLWTRKQVIRDLISFSFFLPETQVKLFNLLEFGLRLEFKCNSTIQVWSFTGYSVYINKIAVDKKKLYCLYF